LPEAILEMSKKGMGMVAVADANERIHGIFTDFDLRRAIEKHDAIRQVTVDGEMNRTPRAIGPNKLAAEAADLMQQGRPVSVLLVADGEKLVGAVHVHDLMRAGVI
jgi:arabinose-5-phosphate isomerase